MKNTLLIILIPALIVGSFFIGRVTMPKPVPDTRIDTVIVRDTIREPVPYPVDRWITRTDTVLLKIPGDTVRVMVEVPIERKVYQTADYKATIEGFRPALVDMEVYRQTHYITVTETIKVPDRRRWGLGVQAGYGATISQGKVIARPYIGVGVSYNIMSW